MPLSTKVLIITATKALRSAETTQTCFPDETFCFFPWFSYIPTIQVPDDINTTDDRKIQT